MKFTLATILAATASAASVRDLFTEFKAKHSVTYRSHAEHERRFAVFSDNMKSNAVKNAALKAKGADEIHGVTKFSDMTQEEFNEFLGGVYTAEDFPRLNVHSGNFPVKAVAMDSDYNLADDGFLTPVKDQAQCGSCWAFSATETIETAWAMAGNDLTVFSAQQIVSCDVGNGDMGCSGGMPGTAMDYVKSAGGLATEADYPYTSTTGTNGDCTSPLPSLSGGTVSTWEYATDACTPGMDACVEDSDALASAIKSHGGISIVVDASSFNSYTGGVITNDSCSSDPARLDHAIQVVGWGNPKVGKPYWIVRNSWAEVWGEDGLIRMEMGENTCGLANQPVIITAV